MFSDMRFLLPLVVHLFSDSVYSQSGEVCIPVPRGPAGPMGPQGPPGDVIQCSCNYTEMENKMRSFQESLDNLSQKVANMEAQNRLVRIATTENETLDVTVDLEEIKEVFNKEWREKNNCPLGISDGRIPDADITSSSVYSNDSDVYGPHLARLDNQPKDGNIGAWRSSSVAPIRSIDCNRAFYSSSGSSSFRSAYFSKQDLVQMVKCPINCFRSGYYSRSLYGSGVYTDFSSICQAAIHDGKISSTEGGVVTVRRVPRRTYPGSTYHRISSSTYNAGSGSFSFEENHLLQWIQVDFHTPTFITGVVSQGRPTTKEEWVERFKIQFGNNQSDLATIKDLNGTDLMFRGNNDRASHVINMFLVPIRARFVRLVAYSWHEAISLRFDFLSC